MSYKHLTLLAVIQSLICLDNYNSFTRVEVIQKKSLIPENEFDLYKTWVDLIDSFIKIIEKNVHDSKLKFGGSFEIPDFVSIISYDKFIPKNLTGLHRQIKYKVNFEILKSIVDLNKLQSEQCFLYISDYCDNKFYIDSEEVEPLKEIEILENSKMNIEQMDANSSQYIYSLKKLIKLKDIEEFGDKLRIKMDLQVPYHLRYNQANFDGFSEVKLGKNFDFLLNCIKKDFPVDSKSSRKTEWILKYDQNLNKSNLLHIQLDTFEQPDVFILPVGNKTYRKTIKKTTIFVVISGMFYLIYNILKFKSD